MEQLIWLGAATTLFGLFGLIWCIVKVQRARRRGAGEDELKGVVRGVIALNLASLFLSALGLIMVVTGIILS